jgi:hypothetical protein
LIERNFCRWPVASITVDAETAMIEGVDGPIGTVTFQNNEFSDMRQGINVGSNVAALKLYNNDWDHILQEAVIYLSLRSPSDEVINNIFYDVGSGGDAYSAVTQGGNPVFQANDFYMPGNGTVGSYPTVEPFTQLDPLFANYGDPTAAGADFHLQSTSKLIGAGVVLPLVTNDFYGNSRGATNSVGAAQ